MSTLVHQARDVVLGVRRLGFGVSGPHGSPILLRRYTVEMIRLAFELGVRVFDVAPSYGDGEAEKRLGEALATLPRYDCIVGTKAGINSSGLASRSRDFSPEGIEKSLEASMQRLRVQRLDWLVLHGPAPHELTDGLLKTLQGFREDGRVISIGVCGRGAELDAALTTGVFSLFMAPVHAWLKPDELERLKRIKASGAELVGFESLTPALPRYPKPTTAGAVWRLARNLGSRHSVPVEPGPAMDPPQALRWALNSSGADRILVSTTQPNRLEQLASWAESDPRRLIGSPTKLS